MRLLERLKNRFYGYLYDSSINVKDRTFVLFSILYFGAVAAALVVGLFLHEAVISTLVSLAAIAFSSVFLVLIVRFNKIRVARIVVAFVMIGVFQPAMFFTKGGLNAGAPFTLLLGTYYLVIVLEGRFRVVMCLIDVVVLGACWLAGYLRPELVTGYSIKAGFIYSFAKYIIVVIVLTAIITFQTRVYQKEAKTA